MVVTEAEAMRAKGIAEWANSLSVPLSWALQKRKTYLATMTQNTNLSI